MHLIRLLSVSDTFTAGEIPVGRYHVVGLKVLPRFRSAGLAVRAPVRPTRRWRGVQEVPAGVGPAKQGMVNPALDVSTRDRAEAVRGPDAVRGAGAADKGPLPGASPRVPLERPSWWRLGVVWLVKWLQRSRNPFHASGMRVARTVRPRQGTLSLEAVQVVCNDLKDSDFELGPASSKGKAKGSSGRAESVACDFQGLSYESAVDRARLGGGRL